MNTCKECIHCQLCSHKNYQDAVAIGKDKEVYITIRNNIACRFFEPKSDYVKRERGEWKYLDIHCNFAHCSGKIKCTNCGAVIRRLTGVNFNFCPYCSADMRKEDNNA